MSYFLRFTANADADLERGYSFISYVLENTRLEMAQTFAELTGKADDDDFDVQVFADENDDRFAQDNVTGMWGARRSGLCGFGPFDSIKEALAAINSDDLSQYWGQPTLNIFEGEGSYDERDANEMDTAFVPSGIAARLIWNGETYA